MKERIEKVKSLFEDKVFVEKFVAAADAEEIKALFWENGVEVSDEEVKALLMGLQTESGGKGELSEEQMDQVAGGWVAFGVALAVGLGAGAYLLRSKVVNPMKNSCSR